LLEIKTGLDFHKSRFEKDKSSSQSSAAQIGIIIMTFLAPPPHNKQCREAVDDLRILKKRERQSSDCRKFSIPESLKKLPYATAVDSNSKSKPATIDKIPKNQDTTQTSKRELLLDNMDRLQRTLELYRNGSLDSDSDSESETNEDHEDDDYLLKCR
jgi:hypothetical protein